MGRFFIGPEVPAEAPSKTSPTSYEWAMKNFSPQLYPRSTQQDLEQSRQESNPQDGEEEKARCEWDFSLSTVVSSPTAAAPAAVSDALGVIEFDPTNTIIATGGIARKIRVYALASLLVAEDPSSSQGEISHDVSFLDHVSACDYFICTPAKLSSLRWRPGSGSRFLGSGDYDGVVTEYDLEKLVPVFERDEHGGRRVWSVDYSHWDPALGASASDDGTMQMWDPREGEGGKCVATVQPSAARLPVCCVEFSPVGWALVAVGCADRKAYVYDVRKLSEPIVVLEGHQKTVSYVRFVDDNTIVSAGIDGCLKLWNVDKGQEIRCYRGHVNSRRFVGLSVWRQGGLVGCGSENNKVVVYDMRWGEPIWVHGFEPVGEGGFVSSVCWSQAGDERGTLVAGGSNGDMKVFLGRRKGIQLP